MKPLTPENIRNCPDERVRLASTAHDHARIPFAAKALTPKMPLALAGRHRRRHLNATVQNQPELTKIDHSNRTISSAQRFFQRNAPEKFFRSNHPTGQPRSSLDR